MGKKVFSYSQKEMLYLAIALTIMIGASFFLPIEKTGRATDTGLEVNVKDRTEAEITMFDYKSMITIYETENISVEMANIGSTAFTGQLIEYIYKLQNSTMNLTSTYTDSQAYLHPGSRKFHKVIFVPPDIGTYFIKATAQYGSRKIEVWGSFTVVEEYPIPPPSNQTNQTQPPPPPPQENGPNSVNPQPPIWSTHVILNPKIDIEYRNNITLYRNQSDLITVRAKNTGNFALDNVFFYVSSPEDLEVDFSPKILQIMQMNESLTYAISVRPKANASGNYTIEFEATNQYVKATGSVAVEVREFPPDIDNYIREKILNYEYMAAEIRVEIGAAAAEGKDITNPENYIDLASEQIAKAKDALGRQDYKESLFQLDLALASMQQALFTLGNLQLPPVIEKAQFPFYIIFFLVIIALLLFFIYFRRRQKKKNRRPKMLERAGEE